MSFDTINDMSLASALFTLANYRSHNSRAAQDTVAKGELVLRSGSASRLGDEEWAFYEQLALAALDVGRLDLTDRCLNLLSQNFPDSPRVEVLTGIRIEATESLETALNYYDQLLEHDSANGAAWKRRVVVLKRSGKIDKAIESLCEYLDTFYNDLEGWLELADLYASCNQYTQSQQALSHALILAPQNPFYVLQFAETAYSANDVQLALKMFLVTTEMAEKDEPATAIPIGIAVRAWWGVKLASRRLLSTNAFVPNTTAKQQEMKLINELATEKVLAAYSSRDDGIVIGKDLVYKWLGEPSS